MRTNVAGGVGKVARENAMTQKEKIEWAKRAFYELADECEEVAKMENRRLRIYRPRPGARRQVTRRG